MKTLKEFLNNSIVEAKKVSTREWESIVGKHAKNFFKSDLDYVEDSMGIGEVEVGLKRFDSKKAKAFVDLLKKEGYSGKFSYELDNPVIWCRHPSAG